MANSMNKSAAVITGTGANSIIRAAKTLLLNHYSQGPLHVGICVRTGAPLHIIYSRSRDFKQGGKRAIMFKNSLRDGPGKAMLKCGGRSYLGLAIPLCPCQMGHYHNIGHCLYGNRVPKNQHLDDASWCQWGRCNRWFLLDYVLALSLSRSEGPDFV